MSEIEEIRALMEEANTHALQCASPYQTAIPHLFFDTSHGVFGKNGDSSLCYTTSEERANYIAGWLTCLSKIHQLLQGSKPELQIMSYDRHLPIVLKKARASTEAAGWGQKRIDDLFSKLDGLNYAAAYGILCRHFKMV